MLILLLFTCHVSLLSWSIFTFTLPIIICFSLSCDLYYFLCLIPFLLSFKSQSYYLIKYLIEIACRLDFYPFDDAKVALFAHTAKYFYDFSRFFTCFLTCVNRISSKEYGYDDTIVSGSIPLASGRRTQKNPHPTLLEQMGTDAHILIYKLRKKYPI